MCSGDISRYATCSEVTSRFRLGHFTGLGIGRGSGPLEDISLEDDVSVVGHSVNSLCLGDTNTTSEEDVGREDELSILGKGDVTIVYSAGTRTNIVADTIADDTSDCSAIACKRTREGDVTVVVRLGRRVRRVGYHTCDIEKLCVDNIGICAVDSDVGVDIDVTIVVAVGDSALCLVADYTGNVDGTLGRRHMNPLT